MEDRAPSIVGKRIGHISVVDVIGEGGMGAVYAGFDDTLQRRVALKAVRGELRLEPETKARFLREARILSQLDHPNVCVVHDFIEGEEGSFIVIELVDGVNLRQALAAGLDEARKLAIAKQLLDVLVAVHERGVIHRDLKPENVMLTPVGTIKVLDFGIARSAHEEGPVTVAESPAGARTGRPRRRPLQGRRRTPAPLCARGWAPSSGLPAT